VKKFLKRARTADALKPDQQLRSVRELNWESSIVCGSRMLAWKILQFQISSGIGHTVCSTADQDDERLAPRNIKSDLGGLESLSGRCVLLDAKPAQIQTEDVWKTTALNYCVTGSMASFNARHMTCGVSAVIPAGGSSKTTGPTPREFWLSPLT
jgi:hypothetical protein